MTAQRKGLSTDTIEFVKKLAADSDISDSAAWLWAKGEVIPKGKIITALKKDSCEKIEDITSCAFLDYRKKLFDGAKTRFGGKLVGLKVIPQLLNKLEGDLVNKSISRPSTWEHIIEFVKEISDDTAKSLQDVKKTEYKTKDQQILEILNSEWGEYLPKIPTSKK